MSGTYTSIAITGPNGAFDLTLGSITAVDFIGPGEQDRWDLTATSGPESITHTLAAPGDWGYNQGSPLDVGVGLGHPILGPPAFDVGFSFEVMSYLDFTDNIFTFNQAFGITTFFETDPALIPLPASLPLLLGGLLGAAALSRRPRRLNG